MQALVRTADWQTPAAGGRAQDMAGFQRTVVAPTIAVIQAQVWTAALPHPKAQADFFAAVHLAGAAWFLPCVRLKYG